uniref:Uncharacterized protein n=1 Tax=Ditylenchus dipsaci TaxID=166011 RepID=A0A915E7X2_9BILA
MNSTELITVGKIRLFLTGSWLLALFIFEIILCLVFDGVVVILGVRLKIFPDWDLLTLLLSGLGLLPITSVPLLYGVRFLCSHHFEAVEKRQVIGERLSNYNKDTGMKYSTLTVNEKMDAFDNRLTHVEEKLNQVLQALNLPKIVVADPSVIQIEG